MILPKQESGRRLCPGHTSLICKDELFPVAKMSASRLTWHLRNVPKGLGERVGMSQPVKKQIKDGGICSSSFERQHLDCETIWIFTKGSRQKSQISL